MIQLNKTYILRHLGVFLLSVTVVPWAYPAGVPSSLLITSPPSGSVFEPGQVVTLNVEPQGAIPEAVAVISPLGTDMKTQPPFILSLAIPVSEPLGIKTLTAVTRGRSDREPVQAAIEIHVETTVPVNSIQAEPKRILFSSSRQRSVSVKGAFADGQTRIITKSREIQYVSGNPQVATVTTDGLIKAVGEGTTTITVTYKGKSATVPVKVEFQRQSIKIDIRPGDPNNRINLDSGGSIPVAILTTQTFDVTRVDPLSVRFGPNGAVETHGRGHFEDVDGDGFSDMVLHFRQPETGIACHQTLATLTGSTIDGVLVKGTDFIRPRGNNCIEIPRR